MRITMSINAPDFAFLPWDLPLEEWQEAEL
jgi:hypothetical protein